MDNIEKKQSVRKKLRIACFIAFALATAGWITGSTFPQIHGGVLLSRYTEYFIIIGFALWHIRSEKNTYIKKRFTILTLMILLVWTIIPNFNIPEPLITHAPGKPVFPNIHLAGTLTFFIVLLAVFLFGRRFICGWCCPCAGIREIVASPFRSDTLRSEKAWKLRHIKWFFFVLYVIFFILTLFPVNRGSAIFYSLFLGWVGISYYSSLFLSPVLGNRSYCRFLCAYGATFGLLNKAGLFRISFDRASCNRCGLCNMACDMGIPVMKTGLNAGKIDVADCVGCGRCITSCPSNSLALHDIKSLISPGLVRNRESLQQTSGYGPRRTRRMLVFIAALTVIFIIASYMYNVSGLSAHCH